MRNPVTILDEYVMCNAEREPMAVRAKLYRALAEVVTNTNRSSELRKLAIDLDDIERRHAQLVLDFKRGTQG